MYKSIFISIIIIIFVIYLLHFYYHKNIFTITDKINSLFDSHCKDPAIFDTKNFSWTENFRKNWISIKKEFIEYSKHNEIPLHNQIQSNKKIAACDTNNNWKTLYLRLFGKDTKITKYFPLTTKLINLCPCTLAYFSILEPNAKLTPHIGIYKGVLRYHLGIIIPKEWNKCFINVNGYKLNWREGSDIMFDDMFMHHVENNTSEPRVILFLDIKRDFNNIFLNTINNIFLKFIKSNDVLNKTIDNVNKYSPNVI